ncbi:hypothetical protein DV36_19650 [Amycolatopsis mediterranei]|nr:hypothetical protein DV36_19650 [Amycolatopsis mediterranei]
MAIAANVVLSTRPARSGATARWISESVPVPTTTPGAPARANSPAYTPSAVVTGARFQITPDSRPSAREPQPSRAAGATRRATVASANPAASPPSACTPRSRPASASLPPRTFST